MLTRTELAALARRHIEQEIARLQHQLAEIDGTGEVPRTGRQYSPAQRKAISERMRKVWAMRKATAAANALKRKARKSEA